MPCSQLAPTFQYLKSLPKLGPAKSSRPRAPRRAARRTRASGSRRSRLRLADAQIPSRVAVLSGIGSGLAGSVRLLEVDLLDAPRRLGLHAPEPRDAHRGLERRTTPAASRGTRPDCADCCCRIPGTRRAARTPAAARRSTTRTATGRGSRPPRPSRRRRSARPAPAACRARTGCRARTAGRTPCCWPTTSPSARAPTGTCP